MSTVAERWMMKGYQEGELRVIKADIITILRFRFKRVPKTIQKQINDQDDMTVLESLFQLAMAAQSLKEFAEEL